MSTQNENDELKGTSGLTTEELKTFPGFGEMTEDELNVHLVAIRQYTNVIANIYLDKRRHE